MSAAIAALLAGLAVVYGLSATTTASQPIDTMLNVIINLFNGQVGSSRLLTADEALTALFYSVVIFLVVFSFTFFVLRVLAIFAAAFGIPSDEQIRLNRDARRSRSARVALMRQQAKYNAVYLVRALRVSRQRSAQAAANRAAEPTLRDFNL